MLHGKTALITGARTGIGRATVKLFAENGANIVAHMRKQDEEFDEFASQLSIRHDVTVQTIIFDLNDTGMLRREMKMLLTSGTDIDILVNNAGVSAGGLFAMTPIDKTREVFENNLFAHMEITQFVLRQMQRRKSGAIVNVASIAGIDFTRGNTTYGVSKAAMVAWTKALALEAADFLIRVNAVAPGLTDTKMAKNVVSATAEQLRRVSFDNRYAKPEEIAEGIMFLASDKASYINGAVLVIDGGCGTVV